MRPPKPPPTTLPPLERLTALIRTLRGPDGCPWDREQTLKSVRAHLLEEAHEAVDAIDRDDDADLLEELGDLAFQIAFVAELQEPGGEALKRSLHTVVDKMVDRHPHVFAEKAVRPTDARAVSAQWASQKKQAAPQRSILEGVPSSMPALAAAYRLSEKAASVGFDWPSTKGVFEKIDEERAELEAALTSAGTSERVGEELGDLLFAIVNLARHLGVDPEAALAGTNREFKRRFATVEEAIDAQSLPNDPAQRLEAMEALWQQAKRS